MNRVWNSSYGQLGFYTSCDIRVQDLLDYSFILCDFGGRDNTTMIYPVLLPVDAPTNWTQSHVRERKTIKCVLTIEATTNCSRSNRPAAGLGYW